MIMEKHGNFFSRIIYFSYSFPKCKFNNFYIKV